MPFSKRAAKQGPDQIPELEEVSVFLNLDGVVRTCRGII